MTNRRPHSNRIFPERYSLLQHLEMIVESDMMWALAEQLEAFHQSRGRAGPRRRYTLMDILVVSAAAHLYPSSHAAIRGLSDPETWKRLCDAAAAAFPNYPSRRLSSRAPSRQQMHRARQSYLSGDALEVLKRGMRAAAVRTAAESGAFDPSAGGWTHPDVSQCIVGDATWIRVSDPYGKKGYKSRDIGTGEFGNGRRRVPGREVVVLSCRGSSDNERMVLDVEFSDIAAAGRNDADRAAAMLRRLLDEHSDTLKLRGFVYDMAMTSEIVDEVLDMGVLPITKVPRSPGGAHQRVNLGTSQFTGIDGTQHAQNVITVNGTPAVVLTDSAGDEVVVLLRRQRIWWGTNRSRRVAYGRYAVPDTPPVPKHLRGASTAIRLNSLANEASSRTRRTRALRAIPESRRRFWPPLRHPRGR